MSWYIKNWDKFQHYKSGKNAKGRPEWIKLYTALLDDIEFHQLSGEDVKTLVMLWMLASEDDGNLPSEKGMAFRLRTSETKIISVLGRLAHFLGNSYDIPRTEEKRIEGEKIEKERESKNVEFETKKGFQNEFLQTFWPLYPHKVAKPDALSSFLKARERAALDEIVAGLKSYIASKPPDRQWCNPSTWLNQERWADQPAVVKDEPKLSRTQHSIIKRRERFSNGVGLGRRAICDGSDPLPSVELSPASSRPGHIRGSASVAVCGQTEVTIETDGEPG